jgi:hypothetical protein
MQNQGLLPELSNFYRLPGRAGELPIGLAWQSRFRLARIRITPSPHWQPDCTEEEQCRCLPKPIATRIEIRLRIKPGFAVFENPIENSISRDRVLLFRSYYSALANSLITRIWRARERSREPLEPLPSRRSVPTDLVFSVVPALAAARTQPAQPLRGAMRSTRDGSELPQRILVALQAALSLVLLVTTGLLIKSMQNLQQQDFGFKTEGRLMIGMERPVDQYAPERLEAVYRNLEQRPETIPGVISASFSDFTFVFASFLLGSRRQLSRRDGWLHMAPLHSQGQYSEARSDPSSYAKPVYYAGCIRRRWTRVLGRDRGSNLAVLSNELWQPPKYP